MTGWLLFCENSEAGVETIAGSGTALTKLMEGNSRYGRFEPIHPDESQKRRKALSHEQHPYAVVVTCSDSRVSPELVFDQGLGDIFVIRTAGNIMGDIELGSIEYAVEHLDVPLVMVVGHERCGAISAYVKKETTEGHLKTIMDRISEEKEIIALQEQGDQMTDHFIRANVQHGVKQISESSPLIRERIRKGNLQIIGAYESLEDGKVSLLN